jgi:hypothetical protein
MQFDDVLPRREICDRIVPKPGPENKGVVTRPTRERVIAAAPAMTLLFASPVSVSS